MIEKTYSDAEMKELSLEEANSRLNDEQFERWNRLHDEKIMEQAERNEQRIEEEDNEAIDALKRSAENKLTDSIEVLGTELEVNISLNQRQKDLFQRLRELENDEDSIEKIGETENFIYELLGEISVNYSEDDWREKFEDVGFSGLQMIIQEIMRKYQKGFKEKNEVVKNFRS